MPEGPEKEKAIEKLSPDKFWSPFSEKHHSQAVGKNRFGD
jgi:hypothetical protein